jgi:hypothetical protein
MTRKEKTKMVNAPKTVTVPVKSATESKINWVNLGGILAVIGTWFGTSKYGLGPNEITASVTAIGVLINVITIILRTFATKSVVDLSVTKT